MGCNYSLSLHLIVALLIKSESFGVNSLRLISAFALVDSIDEVCLYVHMSCVKWTIWSPLAPLQVSVPVVAMVVLQ